MAVLYIAHVQLYFILPVYKCTLYLSYIAVFFIFHVQLYFILPITEFGQKCRILEKVHLVKTPYMRSNLKVRRTF